ncbi:MAG TPA: DNA polymerase III subunit gamma/tau [Candidatus Saccharimonadales bacterium]|nr:DNA polymerase III subunit gamma/tau [Candidatus Saccharimonadales bacterium]
MGIALYRKNRPKSLESVVGQEHITKTLQNAIKKGAISHAYLFTGPRGVGKTSIARILAHEINGLPYTDDSMHLDIIEIDAASNRRIDEIRDLRDRVSIAPTTAKYKVYIIDEVHMLTREAFNALLKTLEEPPAHVVFILATTEAHKLPDTIVSRTQRFTFRPISTAKIVAHLRSIADSEKIDITDDALELIARHGEGSFRDSISLLDQAAGHSSKIDEQYVRTMLGIPPEDAIIELANNVSIGDKVLIVKSLEQMRSQGFGPAQIAKLLGTEWRRKIISNESSTEQDFELLQRLLNVSSAHDPSVYLEIVLLEYAISTGTTAVQTPPKHPSAKAAIKHTANTLSKSEPVPSAETMQPAKPDSTNTPESHHTTVKHVALNDDAWKKVLFELKKKYNTLYGVVRMARPEFKDGVVELGFAFAFHRKRLSEKKNQTIIADIIKDITGESVQIVCVEAEKIPQHTSSTSEISVSEPAPIDSAKLAAPDLASISNIFGGGEVLEQ